MATYHIKKFQFSNLNHSKKVSSGLDELRKSGTLCDVTLKIAGQNIRAHSNILASASAYFSNILGVDESDERLSSFDIATGTEEPQVITQQIIDMNIDAVDISLRAGYHQALQKLIDYIYTGSLTICKDDIIQIIQLAKLLSLDNVFLFCDEFSNTNDPDRESATFSNDDDSSKPIFVVTNPPSKSNISGSENTDKNRTIMNVNRKRCNTCGFLGKTKRELRDHRHSVHLIRPMPGVGFICSLCDQQFNSKKEMIAHRKSVHDLASFSCSVCQKKFRWRWELTKHSNKHSLLRPYICNLCGVYFKTQAILLIHKRLHQRNGDHHKSKSKRRVQYIPANDRNLSNDDDELSKIQTTSASKSLLCGTCGTIFKRPAALKRHVKIMHDERDFTCFICDYTDTVRERYVDHLLQKHEVGLLTEQKPVIVTNLSSQEVVQVVLPKAAKNKGHFPCKICNKVFDMRQNMKRHTMEVHGTSRPFTCSECSFTTKRKEYMANHMRFLHRMKFDNFDIGGNDNRIEIDTSRLIVDTNSNRVGISTQPAITKTKPVSNTSLIGTDCNRILSLVRKSPQKHFRTDIQRNHKDMSIQNYSNTALQKIANNRLNMKEGVDNDIIIETADNSEIIEIVTITEQEAIELNLMPGSASSTQNDNIDEHGDENHLDTETERKFQFSSISNVTIVGDKLVTEKGDVVTVASTDILEAFKQV